MFDFEYYNLLLASGEVILSWGAAIGAIGSALISSYSSSRDSKRSSQSGTSDETVRRGTVGVTPTLEGLLQEQSRFNLEQIRDQNMAGARRDVRQVTDQLFQNYREQALPDILGEQSSVGVFGSSGAQTLANDAFARTTNQAAELSLGLGESRTAQQMQRQSDLEEMIAQLLQIDLNQFQSSREASTGVGSTRGRGSNFQVSTQDGANIGGLIETAIGNRQ